MLSARRLIVVLASLALAGCDVWPTVVQNDTRQKISVQYRHKDYDFWSSLIDITPGKATSLARGHWAKDIQGLKFWDDTGVYVMNAKVLNSLHRVCDDAPTCYITYSANGHVRISRIEPRNIQFMTLKGP